MLWLCASLDKAQLDPKETLFVTLTYPGQVIIEDGKEIPVEDNNLRLIKVNN